MIMDKLLLLSNAQAVTSTAASTDVIDMGVTQNIYPGGELEVYAVVTTAFTAAGAATMVVTFEGSVDNSAWTVMAQSPAIAVASLVAGARIVQWSVPGMVAGQSMPRYFRLQYTIATGPMTAGNLTAGINLDVQLDRAYPPGITISN